ncbi:MAG: ImmA/IrrE family metallo-endopeptidase [Spirochaetia bacterium]|jgi:HTH-type transcriptional regulator/antitoxin HigA
MNALKVLKTEADYRAALALFEKLLDATKGSPEYDERDVLAVLIERYEDEHYHIDAPEPREAIRFRMDQAGLTRKDLAAYIGGKSKVSEVLSGKRDLSLSAIRALHRHLGIPAEVLIKKKQEPLPPALKDLDFQRFPIKEMQEQGAFNNFPGNIIKGKADEAIQWLIDESGGFEAPLVAGFRTTAGMRVKAKFDEYALCAWSLQVLVTASRIHTKTSFSPKALTPQFFQKLVCLSALDCGPRNAQTLLSTIGIILVAVPHLKHTYLDGAVFLSRERRPIIGLTLRYDRLDNFWFVLLHELGHLACKHLTMKKSWIFDDLDQPHSKLKEEIEADKFAREHLLPPDFNLHSNRQLSAQDIVHYARERMVNPAIVAGRIQHERKDYRTFSRMIGRGEVRMQFFEPGSKGERH